MPLVVETGAIVAGANSYNSLAEIRAYAEQRGMTFAPDDAVLEQQAVKAMDFLETLEGRFQGVRTSQTQPLSWPRQYVFINGVELASNEIPIQVKTAQILLVDAINSGINLMPTRVGPPRRSVRIGPIGVDYAMNFGAVAAPVVSAVDAQLAPLFVPLGQLRVRRA